MSNQLSLPYGEVALSSFAFQYTIQNNFPAFRTWSAKHLIIKTPSYLFLLFFFLIQRKGIQSLKLKIVQAEPKHLNQYLI